MQLYDLAVILKDQLPPYFSLCNILGCFSYFKFPSAFAFPPLLYFSKSDYVIFKLKEMGKIREKDVLQICDQFRRLDPSNCGKITLPHLLEGQS